MKSQTLIHDPRVERLCELLNAKLTDEGIHDVQILCVALDTNEATLDALYNGEVLFEEIPKGLLRKIAKLLSLSLIGLLVKVGHLSPGDFVVQAAQVKTIAGVHGPFDSYLHAFEQPFSYFLQRSTGRQLFD